MFGHWLSSRRTSKATTLLAWFCAICLLSVIPYPSEAVRKSLGATSNSKQKREAQSKRQAPKTPKTPRPDTPLNQSSGVPPFSPLPPRAEVEDWPEEPTLYGQGYVGLGVLTHSLGRTSRFETGERGFPGPVYPEFHLAGRFHVSNRYFFFPSLGYTFVGRTARDEATRITLLSLAFPFTYQLHDYFELKAGPGILFYRLNGDGGEVELNNGNTKSTFYRPGGSATAQVFFLNLGAGFLPSKRVRVDLDAFASALFSSRRASVFLIRTAVGVF